MKKNHIYAAVLMLMVTACGNSTSQISPVAPKETSPTVSYRSAGICYVFCDMSASQDATSKQIILQHAVEIFNKRCGFNLKYFDVSSAQYEPPFFEYVEKPIPDILSPSQRKALLAEASGKEDSLRRKLTDLCKRPSSYRTCILQTVEKAVNSLEFEVEKDTNRYIRIIILSDMLEDCSYSFGRLNIDHGSFETAMKVLARMPTPKFTLSKYKNIQVWIIASSQQNLNTTSLFEFWTAAFKKYGYNLDHPISVELPGWLEKDCKMGTGY